MKKRVIETTINIVVIIGLIAVCIPLALKACDAEYERRTKQAQELISENPTLNYHKNLIEAHSRIQDHMHDLENNPDHLPPITPELLKASETIIQAWRLQQKDLK